MFLSDEALAALVATGASPEQLGKVLRLVVRDHEAMMPPPNESVEDRRRRMDRERKAARKTAETSGTERKAAEESGSPQPIPPKDRNDAEPALTCTRVVIPSLPSLRSEEVGGGGVGTRDPPPDDWPKGNGPHLGKILVEAVESPWLDPSKSLDLNTTTGRLAAWKRDGASWEHDVVPVVKALCAKRRGRVASWKYFDDAIARSIADNRAALEIPAAGSVRATGPPRTFDEKSSAMWEQSLRRFAAEDG